MACNLKKSFVKKNIFLGRLTNLLTFSMLLRNTSIVRLNFLEEINLNLV